MRKSAQQQSYTIFFSLVNTIKEEVPFDSKYLRVRQAQFPPSRKQILPVTDKLNGKGNSTYSRASKCLLSYIAIDFVQSNSGRGG